MISLERAQAQADAAAIERETAKTLAYLEACWAENPVLSFLTRGERSPTEPSSIEDIYQGYQEQQSSVINHNRESQVCNLQSSIYAKRPASRIQKPSLATRNHTYDGKSLKQLAGVASQNRKQKKQAERELSPRACFDTKPVKARDTQIKAANDPRKSRAQLNSGEFSCTGDTGPAINTSAVSPESGIKYHERLEPIQPASLHAVRSASSGKKRKWDGDSSEISDSKRPCSEPARKFLAPKYKLVSEQEVQHKMFEEKPKRIVAWLGQLEPESYELMGSPAIEESLMSWPIRSQAPSISSRNEIIRTICPREDRQQKQEQPHSMPYLSPNLESTPSGRVEGHSAERKDSGCGTNMSSGAGARQNELGHLKSPQSLVAPDFHKPNPITERSADTSESSRTGPKQKLVKSKRDLLVAYAHIGEHCSALRLGHQFADAAKVIYSELYDAAAAPDRPTLAITAVCVYLAVRTFRESRSLEHIFSYAVHRGVSEVDCGGTLCQLSQFLGTNYDLDIL